VRKRWGRERKRWNGEMERERERVWSMYLFKRNRMPVPYPLRISNS
jgi:hypothetical protein